MESLFAFLDNEDYIDKDDYIEADEDLASEEALTFDETIEDTDISDMGIDASSFEEVAELLNDDELEILTDLLEDDDSEQYDDD